MLWKEIAIVGVTQYCSGCDSILLRVEIYTAVGGV